jgi:uncharacterized protein (TIGR02246 family)
MHGGNPAFCFANKMSFLQNNLEQTMEKTPTDKDLILALYQLVLQQWNKRNAAGMTGLFATNGSLIGFDGSVLKGQKEIYAVLDEIFSNFPTAAYISIVKDVQVLSDSTGMLQSVVGMVASGANDISPEVNAVQCMTAVKENDQWRIMLLQNTPAAFHGRPELSEQLSNDLRQVLAHSVSQN